MRCYLLSVIWIDPSLMEGERGKMCLFQASAEGLSPVEKSENDESHEPFTYKVTSCFYGISFVLSLTICIYDKFPERLFLVRSFF